MARQRQLERLREFGPRHPVGAEALDQLQRALVLHVDAAYQGLRWDVSHLVRGRCPVCTTRHLRSFRDWRIVRGTRTFCVYGWWASLCLLPTLTRGRLLHGDD